MREAPSPALSAADSFWQTVEEALKDFLLFMGLATAGLLLLGLMFFLHRRLKVPKRARRDRFVVTELTLFDDKVAHANASTPQRNPPKNSSGTTMQAPHSWSLSDRHERSRLNLQRAVQERSDDDLLRLDLDEEAAHLAKLYGLVEPRADTGAAAVVEHGRRQVDCSHVRQFHRAAEWRRLLANGYEPQTVMRKGYRVELVVPVAGDVELLQAAGTWRTPPLRAELKDHAVSRTWDWPASEGSTAFNQEVELFKQDLVAEANRVATSAQVFNGELLEFAKSVLSARRQDILEERSFLGDLKVPVRRSKDLPPTFVAPALLRTASPRPTSAVEGSMSNAQLQLHPLYDHVLEVVRAVGRGLERSPGSFARAEENTLRDHMLVTLNSHYTGETHAEAFNRNGKTDILIRVADRNVFIAECKWWKGPQSLSEALAQLFGYATWRDTRVALIFYVRSKEVSAIIEKARETLAGHPSFLRWAESDDEAELRCRVRWPDDPVRQAVLAAVFVHLPPETSRQVSGRPRR